MAGGEAAAEEPALPHASLSSAARSTDTGAGIDILSAPCTHSHCCLSCFMVYTCTYIYAHMYMCVGELIQ